MIEKQVILYRFDRQGVIGVLQITENIPSTWFENGRRYFGVAERKDVLAKSWESVVAAQNYANSMQAECINRIKEINDIHCNI